MLLELDVTRPGEIDPVTMQIDMDDIGTLDADETSRLVVLCDGVEPLTALAGDGWNRRAADALIQILIERQIGEPVDGVTTVWDTLEEFMNEDTDPLLEATIPMESI